MKQIRKLLVFAIIFLGACSQKFERADGVAIFGTAMLDYTPNGITLDLNIRNTNQDISNSIVKVKELNSKVAAICAKYKINQNNIVSSIIETRIYGLEGDEKNAEPGSFTSFQSVQITIDDINIWESISEDLLSNSGIDINKINFFNTKINEYESDVEILAIQNASENAARIAKEMGIQLGELKYIDFDTYTNEINRSTYKDNTISIYSGSDQWIKTIKRIVKIEYKIRN
jgi:uncharacterized protein YggE